MNNPPFRVVKEKFAGNNEGDALLIEMEAIRNNYNYIGLWYAKDGSEKSFITTELYFSQTQDKPEKPDEFDTEIMENAFKQVNKFEISRAHSKVWIAARNENFKYCTLKPGVLKKDKLYVSFKVIENKAFGFDLLDKGVIKAGNAEFIEIKCLNNDQSAEALMYLILMNDIPPEDWNIDDTYIGIENLPVFTPVFKFIAGRKYSGWAGQTPFKK